jgi:toxin ParE1/3/4
MSLTVRKSELFLTDFDLQFRWYIEKAGWETAGRYLIAVDETLETLAVHPGLGRLRNFSHPELQGLRSFPLAGPFNKHLLFYRFDQGTLDAVRVMHGARDLPKRLREPPGAE